MKKIISVSIALLLIISAIPTVFAGSGFVATFEVVGGEAGITTYTTSDYTSGSENQTTAVARSSSTGDIDESGDGQINFTVVPASGYEVASVTATAGTYKNIKGPADTGKENTYRLTKVKSDTTITVTLQEAATTEPETGDPVITFTNDGVTLSGNKTGITVNGKDVTISASGTYTLTGSCSDGTVTVAKNTGDVTLILDGLSLTSSTSAPVACKSGTNVTIEVKEGTVNTLADSYREGASPKSCINSGSDLAITGKGTLTVNGNNKNGIKADGNLTISSCTLVVNSLDNALSADNILTVNSGNITATAKEGDCLKAAPDEITDTTCGEIVINGGTLRLTAEKNDAIQALSSLTINGGTFDIVTGGGNTVSYPDTDEGSYKAIKSDALITINGGTFNIDSADDAIHSDGDIVINGGTFAIKTGDDGIHADKCVTVAGGEIRIPVCYEGLEGFDININGGYICIDSSDDGVNISSENLNNSTDNGGGNNPGFGGGIFGGNGGNGGGNAPGFGGGNGGGNPALNGQGGTLTITDGTLIVDADGDGLDANGNIVMTGGLVVTIGSTNGYDACIDYDGSFEITGGTIIGLGSKGMAQTPDSGTQNVISSTSVSGKAGNVAICDSEGNVLLSVNSAKSFTFFCFSSPELEANSKYTLVLGCDVSGNCTDGIYATGSTVSGGTKTSLTASQPSSSGGMFGGLSGGILNGNGFFARIRNFFSRIIEFIRNLFTK